MFNFITKLSIEQQNVELAISLKFIKRELILNQQNPKKFCSQCLLNCNLPEKSSKDIYNIYKDIYNKTIITIFIMSHTFLYCDNN